MSQIRLALVPNKELPWTAQFQMGADGRKSLAHQQCLTAGVDAGQQAPRVQPMAESLLAHRESRGPGRMLGHLLAGR
jgi:hypothetical protein